MNIIIAGKRLKRRRATLAFITILALITVISFTFNQVRGEEDLPVQVENIEQQDEFEISEHLELINIVIREGDTAWDIQAKLTPNEDIEELINQLSKVNDKSMDNIRAGDVIQFAKVN